MKEKVATVIAYSVVMSGLLVGASSIEATGFIGMLINSWL